MTGAIIPPAWMEQASCATVGGDAWFPDVGDPAADAKRVCAGCPVRVECLDYALAHGEQHGVWGGKSDYERRKIRLENPDLRRVCILCRDQPIRQPRAKVCADCAARTTLALDREAS